MAKATFNLKRKTDGKGFEKLLDRSGPGATKVGFIKGLGKHPGSKANIAEIAAWNEFGTTNADGSVRIPERPFLRTTIAEQSKTTYPTMLKSLLGEILTGKLRTSRAIGLLGAKAVADVRAKIVAISDPENADLTVRKKKSSNPLIDTGLMRQSVSWESIKFWSMRGRGK